MNTYQQRLLLKDFQTDFCKKFKLDEHQVSEHFLKQWIKKYYTGNKIKVFPKQCFPKEKAMDYKNGDVVIGQDNNNYVCIKRDVYIKFGKTEKKPTVYSYWKRHGFNFDRKLPHLHAREQEVGDESLGNDNETMYVIVLSNNGISDAPYKKWELKYKNVKINTPTEDASTLDIGTIRQSPEGSFYKVNNKNKWLRMRKQPTTEEATSLISEKTVTEEVVETPKKSKKTAETSAPKKKSKKSKKSSK